MNSIQHWESYPRFLRRFGLKNAIWYGDYCRYCEVDLVTGALSERQIHSLLDVGCAGTLFPYYVGRLFPNARILGVDSEENLTLAPSEMTRMAARLDAARRVRLFPADAKRLPLQDGRLDAVTAISVLEHVRENGDTEAVREMARVVRPGGLIAFTVPMSARGVEQEADPSCEFFIRRYDERSLAERLIRPARPQSVRVQYFGEGAIPYSRWYLALRAAQQRWCGRGWKWKPLRYLAWAALALTPTASRVFLRVWDPRSREAGRRTAGGAVVVLENS